MPVTDRAVPLMCRPIRSAPKSTIFTPRYGFWAVVPDRALGLSAARDHCPHRGECGEYHCAGCLDDDRGHDERGAQILLEAEDAAGEARELRG